MSNTIQYPKHPRQRVYVLVLIPYSSFIQTILSVLEFHQISLVSDESRGLLPPPVGNFTLPRRIIINWGQK